MVTHCLCHDVSFEQLRQLAQRDGLTLQQLKTTTGCCTGCGLCEPYVRLMLRTGRTAIPVLSPSQCTELMREPTAPPAPEPG